MKSTTVVVAVPLIALLLHAHSLGQELPTAKPEEVGVSSEKVSELSKFMQALVDEGKIAGVDTVRGGTISLAF